LQQAGTANFVVTDTKMSSWPAERFLAGSAQADIGLQPAAVQNNGCISWAQKSGFHHTPVPLLTSSRWWSALLAVQTSPKHAAADARWSIAPAAVQLWQWQPMGPPLYTLLIGVGCFYPDGWQNRESCCHVCAMHHAQRLTLGL
jgi:hypothetical protein